MRIGSSLVNLNPKCLLLILSVLVPHAGSADDGHISERAQHIAALSSQVAASISGALKQPKVLANNELLEAFAADRFLNCIAASKAGDSVACNTDSTVGSYVIKVLPPFEYPGGKPLEYARVEIRFKEIHSISITELSRALPEWQIVTEDRCQCSLWQKGAMRDSQFGITFQSEKCDSKLDSITLNASWTPLDFPAPAVK